MNRIFACGAHAFHRWAECMFSTVTMGHKGVCVCMCMYCGSGDWDESFACLQNEERKLDDGWPESDKDVFQAALRMVVVKDSR